MPNKKKQHIVPQCYQSFFVDPIPPNGIPPSKYKPAVWHVDKLLEIQPSRKAPKNVLWKPYYYNLETDDPNNPYIEEFLSKIESNYARTAKKIINLIQLEPTDIINLLIFIDTLVLRTESHIDHWQSQVSELEKLYRKVDLAYNGNENYSDEYFEGSHEIAKKMIVDSAGTITSLILRFGFCLIENQSDMPFFTSDTPVAYEFMHIDDLYKYKIPKSWTYQNIGTNKKNFFCYCPLTPRIAFISSPFIKPFNEISRRIVDTPYFVDGMNYLTHKNAESILISSTEKPYVHYQETATLRFKILQNLHPIKGNLLRIYTVNSRYDIFVSKYDRIDKNPICPIVKFWVDDVEILKAIADDHSVELIEYYENGRERGGTRNMEFVSVAIDRNAPTVLKANW
ncbi:MAG: DUF4238 domain-containing protein [Bacteroidales bacterium]|nr:DUF4238 domain-containing protein [Bacteroidales bacterium]